MICFSLSLDPKEKLQMPLWARTLRVAVVLATHRVEGEDIFDDGQGTFFETAAFLLTTYSIQSGHQSIQDSSLRVMRK